METLLYILKILAYFAILFLIYIAAKKSKNKKISILFMVVCCVLFGLYAIWCGHYPYKNDRYNFAFRFEDTTGAYDSFVANESLGLYGLEKVLHIVTYDARALFFTVGFLFMFITLMAYNHSKNSSPLSLLFLLLTTYPTFGLFSLKQAMAMAFISLGYSLLGENEKVKSFLCLVMAILFHEVAWIAVPIFLALKIARNRHVRNILLLFMATVTVFFKYINAMLINIAISIVPSLKNQVFYYLDSQGAISESGSGMVTALKGVPFYYLFLMGLKKRKNDSASNKLYDEYLVLTAFVSITTILSGFMYWMFRFGLLFYMPVSDFSAIIYKSLNTRKEKAIFAVFVLIIPFILSLRLMAQYYFLYGGL